MSVLYIVATPIGNLADITLRALETLKSVDVILCEDTRVTKKLLFHYEIQKPLMSFHSNSSDSSVNKIISMLSDGKSMALVTDAGTPAVSDPGAMLVSRIKSELPEVNIVPIPGVSALTTALSVAGVPVSDFLFLGFLPHKKGRQKLFDEIKDSKRTVVFYESPHRLLSAITDLSKRLGEDRKVIVARELTKMFEQVVFGTAQEILEKIESGEMPIKGEFVILVS